MKTGVPATRDLVLVGGGHSHVQVLRSWVMNPVAGVRLTVISRELHTPYSGMLPGLIAGHYTFDEAHIDLGPLAQAAGARLIAGEVCGITLDQRRVHCLDRPDLRFDLLSINSGGAQWPGAAFDEAVVVPVKPISRFLPRWHELLKTLAVGALGPRPRLVVVGAGAGGVELTLAMMHQFAARRLTCDVTLVTGDVDILADHNARVRRHFRRRLAAAGVGLRTGFMVARFDAGVLHCATGSTLAADRVLWVTGVDAPKWPGRSGLAVDDAGFIRVDGHLRSVSHPDVFAAGDVAALDGQPRPKSGVYAVREGPYLTTNLRRVLQGRSLRRYRAQRRVLALISEGRRSAVLSRGALYARGAMLWRLKDFIDRRFVTRFLSGNAKSAPHDTANTVDLATAMRCGGCGSKLAADLLTRVLRRLDVPVRAELISGIGDDAAVLLTPGRITATVDGFRAMIEDPYRLGRIAAHHALSDVFAMGGRPTAALALVSVPFMADALMEDELYQVMFGACEVLRSEGVALAGGHSSEGTELSVAFAVLGDVPAAPWRKDQLRAGDVLVVTKAIGTGVVLAGAMRGMARSRDVQATIAAMDRSNAPAAAVLAKFDVRAVTDVTGFGLLGHLSEMLRASGLAADIEASAVPVLPGARCLLEQGVESSLAPGNALALSDFEIVSGSPAAASVRLLIDPQTAGGLLAGVAAERADALLAALSQVGCEAAAIGVVRDDVAAGCGRIRVDRGH